MKKQTEGVAKVMPSGKLTGMGRVWKNRQLYVLLLPEFQSGCMESAGTAYRKYAWSR